MFDVRGERREAKSKDWEGRYGVFGGGIFQNSQLR
jgi:hypothetical protein